MMSDIKNTQMAIETEIEEMEKIKSGVVETNNTSEDHTKDLE